MGRKRYPKRRPTWLSSGEPSRYCGIPSVLGIWRADVLPYDGINRRELIPVGSPEDCLLVRRFRSSTAPVIRPTEFAWVFTCVAPSKSNPVRKGTLHCLVGKSINVIDPGIGPPGPGSCITGTVTPTSTSKVLVSEILDGTWIYPRHSPHHNQAGNVPHDEPGRRAEFEE